MKSIFTKVMAVAAMALSLTLFSCGKDDVDDYFTITYYSPDVDTEVPSKAVLEAGTVLTLKELPILSVEGYTFKGWYDRDGQKYEPFTRFIAKAVSLYARFEANKYTVTFDKNGGTLPEDKTEEDYAFEFTYGVPSTLPEVDFVAPDGKQLTKWNSKANGTGKSYDLNSEDFLVKAEDMTLFAVWEDIPAGE